MAMNDYELTTTQKLIAEQNSSIYFDQIDISRPHLTNLNEDWQLSRKINYSIDCSKTRIGKRNIEPPNDIQIGGMCIRNLHAIIHRDEKDGFHIEPIYSG
jgi:hypothetical protein